jgi:hypothetical protein
MPVRRRSWGDVQVVDGAAPSVIVVEDDMHEAHQPGVVLSGDCHAVGWGGAPQRPYRPAVGDNVADPGTLLRLGLLRTRDVASVVFHMRVGSGNDHDGVGFTFPPDHVRRGPILSVHLDDLARADRFVEMPGPDDQPIACNCLHLRHPLRGIAIVHRPAGHGNQSLVTQRLGQRPRLVPTTGAQWNAW